MELIKEKRFGLYRDHIGMDPFWDTFQLEHEEIFRNRWALCDRVFNGTERHLHTAIRRDIIPSILKELEGPENEDS